MQIAPEKISGLPGSQAGFQVHLGDQVIFPVHILQLAVFEMADDLSPENFQAGKILLVTVMFHAGKGIGLHGAASAGCRVRFRR